MKEYYICSINENFENVFNDKTINSLYEIYLRKDENKFYQEQFFLFLKELEKKEIKDCLHKIFSLRNDYQIDENTHYLKNYLTSNYEILTLNTYYIILRTDYEMSPFLKTLSSNFPDLVVIDLSQKNISRLGLVK